jgi:hypothetical protein
MSINLISVSGTIVLKEREEDSHQMHGRSPRVVPPGGYARQVTISDHFMAPGIRVLINDSSYQ